MLKVAGSIPGRGAPIYTAHEVLIVTVGGKGQSIGYTVSDAIVRGWLWSTATRSCSLGYFSGITESSW